MFKHLHSSDFPLNYQNLKFARLACMLCILHMFIMLLLLYMGECTTVCIISSCSLCAELTLVIWVGLAALEIGTNIQI